MKKYRITLNEEQMRVLKDVCELRFRIDLLQDYELSDILARMDCLDLRRENPKHKEIFDSYIERRDHISAVVKALFEIASPIAERCVNGRKRDPDAMIAEDIWQSLRYALWAANPKKNELGYVTDSKQPFQVSTQPLPKIEYLGEK